MNHEMKTRICTFLMLVGVTLVVGPLVWLGPARFTVRSDDITGTCSSVFSGPNDDMGDGGDGQHAQQLRAITDTMTGTKRPQSASFADLCEAERGSRTTWLWVLVGLGVVLIVCAVMVFWPTKSGAA
jgi:hypothetical protein